MPLIALLGILSWLSTTNWMPIGPSPINTPGSGLGLAAGRIEAVAPHPTDGDTMFAAAGGGGVFKTGVWTNDPPVWLPLSDGQQSPNCSGYHPLAVHPANSNLVLATVSKAGGGVLKSTNGGFTWQLLGNAIFEGASVGSLALHPTDTTVIYVSVGKGASGGVWKSTDGGVNWTNTTISFHGGVVSDVVVSRWDPQTLYAGLIGGTTAGVWKTSDGGLNWTQLTSGVATGSNIGAAIRLESGSTAGTVYAAYLTPGGQNAVVKRVKTTDGGQTWTNLASTSGGPEWRAWHLLLGVDPKNDQHVVVNDAYQLFESTDGGASWASIETIGDDWVNVAFDTTGKIAFTADRDLYRYDPSSKTWKAKEGNLTVTTFYTLTLDRNNPDVMYGIAQDQKKAFKFNGTDWAYMTAGGETGKVLVDPSNSNQIYLSNPLAPKSFAARSLDAGQTWKVIRTDNDFTAGDYDLAYCTQKSFVMDPSNPKRLLIGTTKIWETTDATLANPSWQAISSALGSATGAQSSCRSGYLYITALAIAPSDPKTIYAASADGHVWATTDGGMNWQLRDAGLFGPGAGRVVDIRIDPNNPKRAFAVSSGRGGVWYLDTVGGKLQWKKIGATLPTYLSETTVFVDWLYQTPALYVGTTRGVYQSVDLGANWSVFALDLPNTLITGLDVVSPGILVASTYGRSAWAILATSSLISGTIVNVNDVAGPVHVGPADPVEGVVVSLAVDLAGGDLVTAVTDARGRYIFEHVPPGAYIVRRAAPPGFVAANPGHARVRVNGSKITNLDFHYRFSEEDARERAPYSPTSLIALPGQEDPMPLGGKDEFERGSRQEQR
jgi:photosystem II stability/assembly factor-like uncharacterized protein